MDYQPGRVLSLVGAALGLWSWPARGGAAPPPAAIPASTPHRSADDWPAYVAGFIEAYLKADPFFAVQAGRHEFDGQMPDYSAARRRGPGRAPQGLARSRQRV